MTQQLQGSERVSRREKTMPFVSGYKKAGGFSNGGRQAAVGRRKAAVGGVSEIE